jgi:hypothetical protein
MITPEREGRLNEIGFIWNGQQRDGHCDVSEKQMENMDGGVKRKLVSCIKDQPAPQKIRTHDSEKNKEHRSSGIGCILQGYGGKWDTMIGALSEFKQREGHCNVSDKHIENLDGRVEIKLGAWLKNERHQHGQ